MSLNTKFQREGGHLLSRMAGLLEPAPTCQGGDPLPSPSGQVLKETKYTSIVVINASVGFPCPEMDGISVF